MTVSYTHLDVYKRQVLTRSEMSTNEFAEELGSAYKFNAKGLPLLTRQTENGTEGFLPGDVNGDGKVDDADAMKLMEKIAAEEAMDPLAVSYTHLASYPGSVLHGGQVQKPEAERCGAGAGAVPEDRGSS